MDEKYVKERIQDIENKVEKMPDKRLYYAILVLSVLNLILTVQQRM